MADVEAIAQIAAVVLPELIALAEKIAEKIAEGQDPMNALGDLRVAEVLPAENKLALALIAERVRRGLPPDDGAAP